MRLRLIKLIDDVIYHYRFWSMYFEGIQAGKFWRNEQCDDDVYLVFIETIFRLRVECRDVFAGALLIRLDSHGLYTITRFGQLAGCGFDR